MVDKANKNGQMLFWILSSFVLSTLARPQCSNGDYDGYFHENNGTCYWKCGYGSNAELIEFDPADNDFTFDEIKDVCWDLEEMARLGLATSLSDLTWPSADYC